MEITPYNDNLTFFNTSLRFVKKLDYQGVFCSREQKKRVKFYNQRNQ